MSIFKNIKSSELINGLIIAIIAAAAGAGFAWLFRSSTSVDTAQNHYTEQKIESYITLAKMLRDARNPHGRRHEVDFLPVHANIDSLERWWRRVDDYYQENWLLFDDSSRIKYKRLNQLVLDHQDSLEKYPDANSLYKHNLKEPLVIASEDLIGWFRYFLNRNYGTEKRNKY